MTAALADLERFEAQASSAFAPLRMSTTAPGPYRGDFRTTRVGELIFTRIVGDAVTVRRDRELIRSDDPELIKVSWHRTGRAGVEQDDQRCTLKPGRMVAYDTTRPYELRFWEPYDIIVAGIPRAVWAAHTDVFRSHTARPVPADAGTQRLIGTFFTELSGSLATEVSTTAHRHLTDAFISLITSAFAGTPPDERHSTGTLFQRIEAYCLDNLANPDLSMRSIAAAHHISVRYLHKLAHDAGINLATWVRKQRLQRIRADLANPAFAQHTPAAIAARWGILDAKHLSRSLKTEFDETPTQIRRTAGLL
ncbi:AraC-like ligand-binding domain-containing protein [Haloactinomyces albus]|uniref:AraC-like DNA-binding protein n=1 Tax=Haloactinomyces albus TaxID=1352928 RepID=A0AAE3ZI78_9ACTN|nr:helix-turn-helix domain-containing protein [Haloactinomyces albus]MDR7304084.1 AraC-like DNA-binding protein [Haloactinomyces albus]